jgi:hypothetical protein
MIDFRQNFSIAADGVSYSKVFPVCNDDQSFDIVLYTIEVSGWASGQVDIVPQVSMDKETWLDRAALMPVTADGISEYSEEQPLLYFRLKLTASGGAVVDITCEAQTATGEGHINTYQDGGVDVAVAGTAVPLSLTPQPFRTLDVQAKAGNTGDIMIGGATVLDDGTRGINLTAYGTRHYENGDLAEIFINAPNAGDGAVFSFET